MPTIKYRMDVTGIPHTYIVINNGAGVEQMYGFAPATSGNLWGKGQIYDEAVSGPFGTVHPWDYTTGPIEVNVEQYNRVVNEINHAIANPPYYDMPASISHHDAVNQCATWANHLAEVGGFAGNLPWGSNGWNPYKQAAGSQPHFSIFDVNAEIAAGRIDKDTLLPVISPNVNTAAARSWRDFCTLLGRDPLVLDLDDGGIRASAINPKSVILFDHDGDGLKTASGTASNVNLGGGNTQTLAGSFTKTTGATGDVGTAYLADSIVQANNNFYRQFTDDPAVTSGALSLQRKPTGITHRSKCTSNQIAQASCWRLVGHKYRGRRRDATWEFGCGALIAERTAIQIGVDRFIWSGARHS